MTASEFLAAGDFYRAKSIDGFSSFGPWVSTDISRDDIRDGLAITGRVNGRPCQHGNTSRFKFDPGQVISEASRYVTLLPGDVIASAQEAEEPDRLRGAQTFRLDRQFPRPGIVDRLGEHLGVLVAEPEQLGRHLNAVAGQYALPGVYFRLHDTFISSN
jgi:Fumarylacetoacetate (FAA) hydrolase family